MNFKWGSVTEIAIILCVMTEADGVLYDIS